MANSTVKAIYQDGVFHPIDKIHGLKEKQKVELVIKDSSQLSSILKEGYQAVRKQRKLHNQDWNSTDIENWE